ncbi:MAG TPA: YtxH domain-containing protein [Candidatus Saccharimonadales bacterium]|nr:YtxH domain-containing protein [Candidatus Saccharimonadales bacterium]
MSAKRRQSTTSKVAVSSLVASIAGVVGYFTGLLTAPKSGQQTREEIAGKASGIKDGAVVDLQVIEVELKDIIKSTKNKTIGLSSAARSEFDEALVKAKDAHNKAAQVIKAAQKGEATDPDLNKAAKQVRLAIKNLNKFLKS